MENKIEVFRTELNRSNDEAVRGSTETLLDMLPDYFYTMSASTSGKYHPSFALGNGGLVRHTKMAEYILEEMFKNSVFAPHGEYTKDLMRMAILLHDGFKSGLTYSEHTDINHPIIMANFILDNKNELSISESDALFVYDLISTHMGPWTKDKHGNKVLDEPKTREQILIHLCDYIASRKGIDAHFIDNELVDSEGKKLIMK